MTARTRPAHRASFLQAFHTGVSETARKAAIDSASNPTEVPVVVTEDDVFTRKMKAGQRVGRGIVRTISEPQKRLIVKLLAERDISNLTILPGQTIDPNEIGNMGVKGGTALIDKLFNCPVKASASNAVRMATDGQRNYMRSLNTKAGSPMTEDEILAVAFADVQATLDRLKATKPLPGNGSDVSEGMYTVGERIFKVQKARGHSNLYAKELIDGSFTYVAGAINTVRSQGVRMTLEEAKAYGKRTGQCCQCGRELTVKESIEAGIGPICAGKF